MPCSLGIQPAPVSAPAFFRQIETGGFSLLSLTNSSPSVPRADLSLPLVLLNQSVGRALDLAGTLVQWSLCHPSSSMHASLLFFHAGYWSVASLSVLCADADVLKLS